MRFPPERLGFTTVFDGKVDTDGYLTLDLKGLDIEGVTRFVVPWEDIEAAKTRAADGASKAKRLRDILSE